MTQPSDTETICCPKFNPEPWDDKMIEWNEKHFIRKSVKTFFFMPLNFGKVMKHLDETVRNAGAAVPDWLCLSDHTSRWNMDVYLAVDKEVPGEQNVTLTGQYYSKVYEGPFKDTGKWSTDYKSLIDSKGMKIDKWYRWYTTCPKCARKYGKNYVVILSKMQ